MEVIYDISPIGNDPDHRAGLARVAESMAEELVGALGEGYISFAATGSIWATLQAEKVLQRRANWRSALPHVPWWIRRVHRTNQTLSTVAGEKEGPVRMGGQLGTLFLTQVLRAANVLRQPVDDNALQRADIYHSSYGRIPRQVRRALPGRHILTVHDLTPLVLDSKYLPSGQVGVTRRIIDSVQADDWVITVSESTRDDLCERRPISPERVFVVPNAASPDLFYPVVDDEEIRRVRRKYDLPDQSYLLTLHSMAPHKNIPRLIASFNRMVRQQGISDLSLVLAGGLGRSLDDVLEDLEVEKEDLENVHFTGFVADEDLAALYSGAEAFVFPSLYEGFGLPVLEAMQCGCPVIASNTSSIPEIAGEAAILVDPHDEERLSESMWRVHTSPEKRKKMSERGMQKAKDYSWESRAKSILGVYEKISRLDD
ncbi:glycosyltransferase involved in cell wall biosynthesis [Salinibacter ruber]|uniref:glycosyltransferase family 4 protein n=1 Tax=Salinibacter ruber TaxID=146919 RepID=UPI00216A708C|nr:glycosyltransferase family 1 protein [Salinibacter ruber]MCS4191514.1 glycosyltransferase involved in cell wall biosynthesis [Salinibacter ruber]